MFYWQLCFALSFSECHSVPSLVKSMHMALSYWLIDINLIKYPHVIRFK